jgi:hypothetical protein
MMDGYQGSNPTDPHKEVEVKLAISVRSFPVVEGAV